VLEHLNKIAAIDPTAASRAPDEVLGLARRRIAEPPLPFRHWTDANFSAMFFNSERFPKNHF
jgi:hypothetical protein